MNIRQSEIEKAAEKFKALLTAQCARAERMKIPRAEGRKGKIRIGLIDGDGIGPIIVRQAKKVLSSLLKEETESGKAELVDIDGLTLENRLRSGASVPEDILEKIKTCDVLLKGPTETPKGGTMESANVTLRRSSIFFPTSVPCGLRKRESSGRFSGRTRRENTCSAVRG